MALAVEWELFPFCQTGEAWRPGYSVIGLLAQSRTATALCEARRQNNPVSIYRRPDANVPRAVVDDAATDWSTETDLRHPQRGGPKCPQSRRMLTARMHRHGALHPVAAIRRHESIAFAFQPVSKTP
jgi:hypothetical protein